MSLVDKKLLQHVLENKLNIEVFKGRFGLEKENIRVDHEGKLALTPHPKVFGSKRENPYIKVDFSESQIEMNTPVFDSIDETYHFLEALHDIVTLELADEYLWPSSNPPTLPEDELIPIASMDDPVEDEYRHRLAEKYGRKKQLLSGIHYNFSFHESFLRKAYDSQVIYKGYKEFKDSIYLKVARNLLRYRWMLVYLTGASPVFDNSYEEKCVQAGKSYVQHDHYFPWMNSLRNSKCGYRNKKPIFVSFDSVEQYVENLQEHISSQDLLSHKEFYNPVRLKAASGGDQLNTLLEKGIDYLELRVIDLNPLDKIGINKDTMVFVHLFLILMYFLQDKPFGEMEQRQAFLKEDWVLMNGLQEKQSLPDGQQESILDEGLNLINEMEALVNLLVPNKAHYLKVLEQKKNEWVNPEECLAFRIKENILQSSFINFHLKKAMEYAMESKKRPYQFIGYEDLELSTQLLLKAAIKRGIRIEILDWKENFIVLTKGNHQEFVKQATKTSLDSYITALIMENKIVSKKILQQHGIRVPKGESYHRLEEALEDFETHQGKAIVIKPKSTNFGIGITIFTKDYTIEDYQKAFEMAFEFDDTVLLEEFMTGKEYRFLVMGDEVVGILHRVPANIVGDGIHTIEELVAVKNKDPLRGHGYKTPLEMIQLGEVEKMFLKNQSLLTSYIPQKGEVVYLRENSNISTGGDSVDYTDDIPESYKKIAIQSAKAAGAIFCGVDMVIDDFNEEANSSNYGIIEINFNPAIHIHCYPYIGKNRRAEEKILDLLFGKEA